MTSDHEANRSDPLDVSIDRDAEVPMGVQLGWVLRSHIRDGSLKPGQRLPALREMAAASGLNINTVRAVYQRLEQKGLIDSQQGSGTFVTSTERRSADAASIAANAAHEAFETGVDPREVAAALYVLRESSPGPADHAAGRRRALRTQIAVLERAIGDLEASHPDPLPASTAGRGPGPMLLGVGELEQVRTQLIRRLVVVQSAIDEPLGESAEAGKPDGATARPRRARKPTAKPDERKAPKRAPKPATQPAPAGA
jgi:GntR family transcriptional regulator